ncbi:MAG: DUF1289 domain-containing protein [Alkalilacustris sp.]
MTNETVGRAPIDSPCIKVCVIHPDSRLCTGCLRTIDEITRWASMAPDERRTIMAALPSRAGQLTPRRAGRQPG